MSPVILAFWPLVAGPLEQAEETFLRTVLRRNLQIRVDSLDLASTSEAVVGARAGLEPALELSADAGATFSGEERSARQGSGTAEASQWVPGGGTMTGTLHGGSTRLRDGDLERDIDTAGAQIAFTQPLLKGFGEGSAPLHQYRQAVLTESVRIQGSRATLLAQLLIARKAYWSQLALAGAVASGREDSVRTDRLLEASRIRFTLGAASELDTLQARAEFLRSRSNLLSARSSERTGWRLLLDLSDTSSLGLPVLDSGSLPESTDLPLPDSAKLVEKALADAPDLAQAAAQIEKSEDQARYLGRSRLPQLDVTGLARTDLLEGGWVAGAKVHFLWNIPDGATRSKYRQALLGVRSDKIRRQASEREVASEIGRVVEELVRSRMQLRVAVELSRAQDRRLQAAEAGWNLGKVPWSDLASARRDALDARSSAWKALASSKAAEAELESRTGTGPERLGWMGDR